MTDAKFFELDTNWDELETARLDNGIVATRYSVAADQSDTSAPVVFRVSFPAGVTVGVHTHDCDYSEIILEGTQRVGRTWHGPGTVRIVQAGTAYGPLEAGPDGCVVIVVFRDGRWPAVPVGKVDRATLYVDDLQAELTSPK